MNHVSYKNPEKIRPKHTGVKTNFRIFSKQPAYDLATRKLKIQSSGNEIWLFWHDFSRFYFPGIRKQRFRASIDMLSPLQINWQVQVYFGIRRDMIKLGLGPFSCPFNMNSGIHAILLFQNLCRSVGIFGMSFETRSAKNGAHYGDSSHVMSTKHSWDFDTLMLRVMNLSRHVSLCT